LDGLQLIDRDRTCLAIHLDYNGVGTEFRKLAIERLAGQHLDRYRIGAGVAKQRKQD
jgi:hypothetical protein